MTEREHPTVLITGSSSGFGREAVALFRTRGWNVVATSRTPDTGEQADDLLVAALDVHDTDSIDTAISRAVERFGRLDCVVNNAGQGLLSVFEGTPMTTVRQMFETNLFGMMEVTRRALPHLSARGGGRVVNVASGAGIVPEPFMTVYAATKFAVEGFSEALRYELAPRGITVKLVEPGLVRGTNFMDTTTAASLAIPVPPAYQDHVNQAIARYMEPSSFNLATPAAVAEAIVTAATDTTSRLRYVIGEDIEATARMRRETSEKQYNDWALATYGGEQS
jgi:NAD(P)-dependent dehydrogenase (short-subunit alcohol dehydrogenase family)